MNKASELAIFLLGIGALMVVLSLELTAKFALTLFTSQVLLNPSLALVALILLVIGGPIFFIGLVIGIIKGLQWVIKN